MKDENKTKKQLITELKNMRRQIRESKTLHAQSLSATRQKQPDRRKQTDKGAWEAVRLASAELSQIFQTAADGICVIDKNYNILRANESFLKLFDITASEAVGKKCYDVICDTLCHTSGCALARILTAEKRVECEVDKKRNDSIKITCILTATPFRGADGNLIGVVENFKDITERKVVEDALKQSEQKYRFLVENSDELILILSKKGKILFTNNKAVDVSGYTKEQLIGQSITKFLVKDSIPKALLALAQEFIGRRQPIMEVKIKRKSGEIRYLEIAPGSTPVYENGGLKGILINGWDITERKRVEETLSAANNRLKILQQVIAAVHESLEPQEVFNQITDVIVNSMGFNTAIILTFDDEQQCYLVRSLSSSRKILRGIRNILGYPLQDLRIRADQLSLGIVEMISPGKLVVKKHLTEIGHPHLSKATCEALEKLEGSNSFIVVPLVGEEKVIGGITITSSSEQVLSDELNMLQVFARAASQAIANANLHHKTSLAEEGLAFERFLFSTLMNNIPDDVYFKDKNSRIIRINKAKANRHGLGDPTEAVGMSDYDFFSDEHARLAYEDEKKIMRTGQSIKNIEEKETWPDGKETLVSTTKMPMRDKGGKIIGTFGISRDITDRKRIEEELRASEAQFRFLAENTLDIIYRRRFDSDTYDYIGPTVTEITGYSPEEFSVKFQEEVILARERLSHQGLSIPEINKKMASGQETIWQANYKIRAKNGDIKWLGDRATVWRDNDDNAIGTVGVLRDITEEMQVKKDLIRHAQVQSALKETYEELLHESPIEKISASILSRCLKLTCSAFGLVGLVDSGKTNMVGSTKTTQICNAVDGDDKSFISAETTGLWDWVVNNKKSVLYNHISPNLVKRGIPDNHVCIKRFLASPSMYNGDLLGVIALGNAIEDYTDQDMAVVEQFATLYALAVHREHQRKEQQSLQSQLAQSQKMEAVGTLAGGIAHDFNNLLTGIIGGSQLLFRKFSKDSTAQRIVQQIEESGRRAAELTGQLLTFSHRQPLQKKPTNINQVVAKMARLLQRSILESIDIQVLTDPQIPTIAADEGQIRQVLLNLGINARDAMPEGGKLSFKTSISDKKDLEWLNSTQEVAERYICVSVTDTGVGMDEATQQRIFEPFFTTKEVGKGTGLGLSIVYGIINNHGGWINVMSSPGQGSTFDFNLPAIEIEPEKAEPDNSELPMGTEKILLVDDDETILYIGRGILERFGYTVLKAESAMDAISIFEQNNNDIQLVIADLIMPKMGGRELLQKLRETGLNTPVLLISGYDVHKSEEEIKEEGFAGFIPKPFNLGEITQKIRSVLDQKQ